MKRIFTFLVAAVMLATAGIAAQNKTQPKNNQVDKQSDIKQRLQNRTSMLTTAVSYTTLDYSTFIPTDGSLISGSLNPTDNAVLDPAGYNVIARGYSFQATAGKTYEITATYTTTQSFNDYADVYVLNQLTGYSSSDVANDFYVRGYGATQLTVTGKYVATTSKDVKLLIDSYDMVSLNYQIKIEEINAPNYTLLDYSTTLSVNNTPATGTLSESTNPIIIPNGNYSTGTGYSFSTQAGKVYKITCTYQSTLSNYFSTGFYLLIGGALQNNYYDIIRSKRSYDYGSNCTVTDYYAAANSGSVRLLLYDSTLNDLNYTVNIEEITVPIYTALDYSTVLQVNGDPITGTLSESANAIVNPYYEYATGTGCSFAVQAGKTYNVTCNYFSPENIYFNTESQLLTGGTLNGNWAEDIIMVSGGGSSSYSTNAITTTATYTATANGNIRILLTDFGLNNLMYSIQVKETTVITLPKLLDNTTNSIVYSDNMQFTANGSTTDLVEANSDLSFKYDGLYYAVAYKIALAAGNNIKIHSSKEGDSYLYIYKVSATGGYTYIDRIDDGGNYDNWNDSYLNFTADTDGFYYIVVSDYNGNTAGRYFLSVWNTATEPANSYPDKDIIIALSSNNQSVTVNTNATADEIRTALSALVISASTDKSFITMPNNPYAWVIADNGISASYFPSVAPDGCVFDSDLQPVIIAINYNSTGINDVQANSATIYAVNKSIVVRNAQVGSNVLVTDITGKIIANTVTANSETSIPVANIGLYIVRVGTQTAKVICK